MEPTTFNRWVEFVGDYSYIDRINIPRLINFNSQRDLPEICDASEKAYAAILYSRDLNPSDEFVTQLLAAKVKVVLIGLITLFHFRAMRSNSIGKK